MQETKVAILGYGGIARQHLAGIGALAERGLPIRCVAVCDRDPKQFEANLTINIDNSGASLEGVHLYTDLDEMLAKEDITYVDICLPSFLHKEYAVSLLRRGYHVLCEKPMALTGADCEEMIAAAEESGKQLMIGQCLRFEPAYLVLKDLVDSGKYGNVRIMHCDRLSMSAVWGSGGWYMKNGRVGGSMMEVGIHDFDMANFLFGPPQKVSAVSLGGEALHAWANTRFMYDDGKIVTCNCGWIDSPTFVFKAAYHVTFDQATVVFEGTGAVHVYPAEGEPYDITPPDINYMAEEILYFAEIISGDRVNEKLLPASTKCTVELVNALQASAEQGGVPLDF